MDANPSFSLSVLYRSDPIYSLCASDLMTASQTVNNNFIKEQKQLIKTLRRLEQQQLIRMRQLREEQRTFAFTMNKRLSQRGARPQTAPSSSSSTTATSASSIPPARGSQSAPAALTTRTAESRRVGSARAANTRGSAVKSEASSSLSPWVLKRHGEKDMETGSTIVKEYEASTAQRCCDCGHTRERLARRLSCPAMLQRHPS